jgi:hypothetical protein
MKRIIGVCFGLSLFAACAVEPSAPPDEQAAVSELNTGAQTNLTCSKVWECDEICGTWINGVLIRYSTNVLHKYCDDGSDTVVQTHACGESCF